MRGFATPLPVKGVRRLVANQRHPQLLRELKVPPGQYDRAAPTDESQP
jgi:hypothetical protein